MQKITVVNTNTQSSKTLNSDAKTLGELKSELSKVGMDYSGCTFFESTNKVELNDDASVIPTAQTAKGIVFMLTKPNKHISSGAGLDRKQLYADVKALNLGDSIKKKYSKNFTMVSSADLAKEVEAAKKTSAPKAETKPAPAKAKKEEPKKEAPKTEVKKETAKPAVKECDCTNNVVKAIMYLAEKTGYSAAVECILKGEEPAEEEEFTAEELQAMQAYAMNRKK